MTSSKRLKLARLTPENSSRSHDIFYNPDLLSLVFTNLKILEILKLIKINTFMYNYLKANPKSLPVIRKIIEYDFGDVFSSFESRFTPQIPYGVNFPVILFEMTTQAQIA